MILMSSSTTPLSSCTTSLPPIPKLCAGEEKDAEWATLTAATDESLAQAEKEGAMETAAGGGGTVSGIGETSGVETAGGKKVTGKSGGKKAGKAGGMKNAPPKPKNKAESKQGTGGEILSHVNLVALPLPLA